MVIFNDGLLPSVRAGLLEFSLAAVRTTPAPAGEMLVGVQTDEEQTVDFAAFQRLVGFELLVDWRQRPAQIRQTEALRHIFKGVVADAPGPMDQMAPAPTFGLLG